jgi:hypothetical protein
VIVVVGYFERVWKLQPRCMAMFGPFVEDIFLLIHQARREVEVAAQMLGSNRQFDHEMRTRLERDVWDMGNFEFENDKVGKKLADFRARTEALCKPVIEREFRRLPWRNNSKKGERKTPA